jgi:hypothetical protein
MLLILSEKNLYPVFCKPRISIMTVGNAGGHFETKKWWIRMVFESTAAVKNGSQ